MPASKTSLRVTERYQNGMIALRRRAQAEARKAWAQIDLRDIDATYPVGALALTVSVMQKEAARLSAAYLHAFVSSELGHPVSVPLIDARQVGRARNGDALRKSFRSPVIGVKIGIRDGKDSRVALAEGGRVLERMVGLATDTAARESLHLALQDSPYVLGWRRAIRGTCGACMGEADGQVKGPAHPLHIHPNCACVSEPAVKAEPYTPKKGERIEVQNALENIKGKWQPVQDPIRGKVVKITDERVMIDAGTAKRPRFISAKREDAYRPQKVISKPLDDLFHTEAQLTNYLNNVAPRAEYDAVSVYKGPSFARLNSQLRKGGSPDTKTVRNLDAVIEKNSLGTDTTLYRSFHFPADQGVGSIFSDKAFMSTSSKRAVAERFENVGGKRTLVRIQAKKGQRGGHFTGQEEAEFVLPRNTRIRIVGDKVEHGVRVLDAEILG